MSKLAPVLYLSHGAPSLAIEPSAARDFLTTLGHDLDREFGRPRAVIVASAHWESDTPLLTGASAPPTIHDFGGFPEGLYRMRYPAPGAVDTSREACALLREAGFDAALDPERGFDHGAWVPLRLMYPEADVPISQLSIQSHLGPEHHLAVGHALAPLREKGVAIVGSGAITHNLRELFANRGERRVLPHVEQFVDWISERIDAGDLESLVAYRSRAPHGVRNHPTDEHLLPLFVAIGAATPGGRFHRIHSSATYGSLRMDSFAMA